MTTDRLARRRRRLRWAVGALALLPTITGVAQAAGGARSVPGGGGDVTPSLDGELRYANTFKAFVGPLVWRNLGDVETSPVVTTALVAVGLGGVTRGLSWLQVGRPGSQGAAATALEIMGVPILLVWRARVARAAGSSGSVER